MHPILLTIGGKEIHFYQVFYPLSLLLGVFLSVRRMKKEGFSEEIALKAFICTLFGVLVGSRLLDVVVNTGWYIEDPKRIFVANTGVVLYGGYLGAVAGSWGYFAYKRHPILPMQDIASTYFGLGLFVHRSLACFMAGCCYGAPTDLPWGVVYPVGARAYKAFGAVPVHPTQLYEAFWGLLMFGVMVAYRDRKKNRFYGELFALQLAIYGVGRFLIELMRGDAARGRFGFFSTSQWISVALMAGAMILAIIVRRRKALVSAGKLKRVGVCEPPPLRAFRSR